MIGALIGAGLGVASSIWGGISAAKAAKQAKNQIHRQEQENQNWFDKQYYQDATQRADAQRMLRILQDNIRRRNQNAQGRQAVMGATSQTIATEQEAGNNALAQATTNITANAEARKDAIQNQYIARKNHLSHQLANIERERSQNISKAIGGVLQAGAGIASAFNNDEKENEE